MCLNILMQWKKRDPTVGDIKKSSGHHPVQLVLGGPA